MEKSVDDSAEPTPRGRIEVRAFLKRAKTGEVIDLGVISEGSITLDTPDSE
jgi:hypothetical protein